MINLTIEQEINDFYKNHKDAIDKIFETKQKDKNTLSIRKDFFTRLKEALKTNNLIKAIEINSGIAINFIPTSLYESKELDKVRDEVAFQMAWDKIINGYDLAVRFPSKEKAPFNKKIQGITKSVLPIELKATNGVYVVDDVVLQLEKHVQSNAFKTMCEEIIDLAQNP